MKSIKLNSTHAIASPLVRNDSVAQLNTLKTLSALMVERLILFSGFHSRLNGFLNHSPIVKVKYSAITHRNENTFRKFWT